MTSNSAFSVANIYVSALSEEFWSTGSVVEDKERHNDFCSHFIEAACQEVVEVVVASCLHIVDSVFILFYHLSHTFLQCLEFWSHFFFEHFLDDAKVSAVGHIADSCHHLKLGSTFVDREDTSVAEQALALVFHDEARTTVNRNSIVSVLVGVFRVHTLCQWSERIGKARIKFHFLALFWGERAVASDVFECLVDINVASGLVKN